MLVMTGYAHSQLDQNQKALEKFEQSLALFRAAHEPRGEATALLHLALLQGKLGEWQKALDNFDKALPLFRAAGMPEGEMLALGTLGSLNVQLGKPEELIRSYDKVLEIARATHSQEGNTAPLRPLYAEKDPYETARQSLEKAVLAYHALGLRRFEGAALLTLGLLNSFELKIPTALKYYEQALPLFEPSTIVSAKAQRSLEFA